MQKLSKRRRPRQPGGAFDGRAGPGGEAQITRPKITLLVQMSRLLNDLPLRPASKNWLPPA